MVTLALFAAAVVLALAGTRLAGVVFVAAAAASALHPDPLTPVVVWTGAAAAGLLVLGTHPRRVATPAAGACAVLVAGAATNAALFLPAWAVASAAALVFTGLGGPGARAPERRWALGVLVADIPVGAAVVVMSVSPGFAAWPTGMTPEAAVLLLLAAALRAPLAAGALDGRPEGGLLVVRTQTVVLLVLAAAGGGVAGHAAVGLGVLLFAVAALAPRASVRDALAEAGLVAMTLGGTALGWRPGGWVWGALAAGTLVHLARVASRGPGQADRPVWDLVRSGGLGGVFLPPAAAVAAGAVGAGGAIAAPVTVGLAVGLVARSRVRGELTRSRGAAPPWAARGIMAAAVAAAVSAPLLTYPRELAGNPLEWPPGWALLLLGAGAVLGARSAHALSPARVPSRAGPEPPYGIRIPLPAIRPRPALVAALVLLGAVCVLAGGLWALGWVRGFL